MLPGKTFSPQEALRILGRRWWILIPPIVLSTVVGLFLASRMTPLYRSETLIFVVPQRIPDAYVKSMVTTNIEDRLPSIKEQILSRSRLERIILDFDLYPGQRARGIMEDVVASMRDDVKIQLEGKESFRVAYVSRDARTAQQVTQRLASLTIEENLRERENLTANASQFIESQLEDAKARLLEHEQKLEAYRRQHAGELPSQLQGNLQAVQNGQLQLQALAESNNRMRERRLEIQRQLGDAHTAAPPPAPAATGQQEPNAMLSAADQLNTAQATLELYRMRYTPDHPDVRALERTIKDLEGRVAAEPKQSRAQNSRPQSIFEAQRESRVQDLQNQIENVDRQIAANQSEDSRLRRIIAEYQRKVDQLPTRESELVELTRDYATLQSTYATLLQKKEDSKLAANLERRQVGEQFKILDPASLPERPYNQNERLGTVVGATFAGLLFGVAIIGFIEFRDSSFRREEEVFEALSLPVLALVPFVKPPRHPFQRRRARQIGAAAITGIVAMGCAAAFVLWRLQT